MGAEYGERRVGVAVCMTHTLVTRPSPGRWGYPVNQASGHEKASHPVRRTVCAWRDVAGLLALAAAAAVLVGCADTE